MPREFFENHVRPNFEAWEAEPNVEYLAKNAVGDLNNMAERAYHHWRDRDSAKVYNARGEGDYREQLAARECDDFALIRDIAEAYKHVELRRRRLRRVTRSSQTAPESVVFGGPSYFGGAVHFGGEDLIVTLDDGTKRPLEPIMLNVMAMWERLLATWGL